jgi:hypothetical protein
MTMQAQSQGTELREPRRFELCAAGSQVGIHGREVCFGEVTS